MGLKFSSFIMSTRFVMDNYRGCWSGVSRFRYGDMVGLGPTFSGQVKAIAGGAPLLHVRGLSGIRRGFSLGLA